MRKIQRNDPCPCGSRKKYKHCCGKVQASVIKEYKRQDIQQADFVINNIDRDWLFLCNAIQIVIGTKGYQFCKRHQEELHKGYETSLMFLKNAVLSDELGVYSATKENSQNEHIWNTMAYGRELLEFSEDISKAVEDFPSLAKRGVICKYQITLLHLYILDNIQSRFEDYFYAPSDNWLKGQHYGILAHRGFDYLIGISLYLELQLGVHLYDMGYIASKQIKARMIESYFYDLLDPDDVTDSMFIFLDLYVETIKRVTKDYDPVAELAFYRRIGALNDADYKSREALLLSSDRIQRCSYQEYLILLVGAVCFNKEVFFVNARLAFPQCDFIKMLVGIENVYNLFESEPVLSSDDEKAAEVLNYNSYYETVFLLMDELYGNSAGFKEINKLRYKDPNELIFEEEKLFVDPDSGDNYAYNPAAKSTSASKYRVRKLRMELYDLLSGKTIPLIMSPDPENPTKHNTVIFAGNYLMIPWLSNGTERTVHSRPFDRSVHGVDELYSENIQDRKAYLNMEYRLTEIPVNCIEEYLNPNIYNNWLKLKKQNIALQEANYNLKRHIQLNQELVRNLSHSSANYLNSDKLAQTGIELHKAENGNPTIEKLHIDGLSLLLQSEQEMYLSRQLKSLVWRCSADIDTLTQQIRGGLSKKTGSGIIAPIEFALKIVMARILFRDDDRRADFIRGKLNKSEDEMTRIKSTFMLDILANETETGNVIEWWTQNICKMSLSISTAWKKLLIIDDKSFYDLITEIVTEQILNAMSHGNVHETIDLEFGQADEFKGRPRWTYILCKNKKGDSYAGGRGVGISTLNETILLLNSNKRGIEIDDAKEIYESKVWLLASLTKPL